MSEDLIDIVTELRNFMFKNVYLPVSDSKPAKSAMKIVDLIFDFLVTNPDKVPEYLLNICDGNIEKATIDYITGMTDDFALRFSEKFDKSLAIIPNFQFAENAVVNVSETSNWLISWIITLQYDTTVDQLKTVRDQIEDHINKSEDFDVSIGIAVRVDKFSDSSIVMYVRCFTKTNKWNEWLSVKEKLAIAIKQIVENNNASFAFPSSSIYIEKK